MVRMLTAGRTENGVLNSGASVARAPLLATALLGRQRSMALDESEILNAVSVFYQ